MKSHPGVAAKTFATLERAGIEPQVVSHLADQDRLPRRARRTSTAPSRRSTRRSSLALADAPASASSARPARSARSRSSCSRERGYENVRAFASARSAGRARSAGTLVEEATPEALAARRARPLPLLGRDVAQPGARPARGRGRRRSASTSRRPTGSSRGVPLVVPEVNGDRRARARRHRRQPELLRDPAHLRAEAAARRGRPRARARRDLPVGLGRRRAAMERLRARVADAHDLRMDWDVRRRTSSTRSRSSATRRARSSSCRSCRSARPACACPCSSATPRRSGSRSRSRSRPSRRRELLGAAPSLRLERVADAGRRGGRRRRARRPDPPRPHGRERARALPRGRQPAQGRGAERDPDRGAPALASDRVAA